MNEQHDTTTPALPAMPDFETAFYALEELFDVARRRVKTVEFLVDSIDDRATLSGDPYAKVVIHSDERDALHSTARDAAGAIDDLSRRFDSVVAQVVAAEHAMREARETAQIKTEDSSAPADPLLAMIVELRSCRSRERARRMGATGVGLPARVLEAEDIPEDSLWNSLAYSAPPALTAAAARAALNEALFDLGMGEGPLAPSLIRSALAYLGSAHVQ